MNEVTMCEHLIEGPQLNQPFALLAGDDGDAAYLCPTCLVTHIQHRIETQSPSEINAALSFAHCDHQEQSRGNEKAHCNVCEIAGTSALALRHSVLRFSEPATANRIGKLLRYLGNRYDRCAIRAIDPGPETKATPSHSTRLLKAESLNGDRARAAHKWEEGRKQRQRTLRPPAQTIRVIPPLQNAAVA
jgi:hypothetical protein